MTMSVSSSDSDEEFQSYSERTLAIIKPEAYEDTEAIENHIKNHGFTILAVSRFTYYTCLFGFTYTFYVDRIFIYSFNII